jgi:SAM-dependent methyltransferase
MDVFVAGDRPTLTQVGALIDGDRLIAELDEPLQASAPINFVNAGELCEHGSGATGCYCYHAIWQYLRLANVTPAVRVDGALFVDAAERFARAGRLKRILISATADYSMLAHLAFGAARAGKAVEVDVLDRCGTALAINAWYARERGISVRVFKGDVLAVQPDRQYDLICTHSFLPFVSDPAQMFRRWAGWLVPGGHVCFSNRVSPQPIPFNEQDHEKRIAAMTRETLDGLHDRGVSLPCPEVEFAALVRGFVEKRRHDFPAFPLETIQQWMTAAGLVPQLALDVKQVLGGRPDKSVRSGSIVGRPRIWFQATRP